MARGWESKSVEEQMASAADKTRPRVKLTPEQIAMERKRDSLLLQRTRVARDLEKATDPRYRKTLASGLEYLDAQLKALDQAP